MDLTAVTDFNLMRLLDAGAGLVPLSVAAADLAAGRLGSWGASDSPPIEASALHASRRLTSPKVTAFVQCICDYLAVSSSS